MCVVLVIGKVDFCYFAYFCWAIEAVQDIEMLLQQSQHVYSVIFRTSCLYFQKTCIFLPVASVMKLTIHTYCILCIAVICFL